MWPTAGEPDAGAGPPRRRVLPLVTAVVLPLLRTAIRPTAVGRNTPASPGPLGTTRPAVPRLLRLPTALRIVLSGRQTLVLVASATPARPLLNGRGSGPLCGHNSEGRHR